MLKITISTLLIVIFGTTSSISGAPPKVTRVHYQVVTAGDRALLYDVTRITEFHARATETTCLVSDRLENRRYILSSRSNFEAQTQTFEIRDVTEASKAHLLRSVIKLPLQPDTASGTQSQLAALSRNSNLSEIEGAIPVTIEVRSMKDHQISARADAWQNAVSSGQYRDDLKASLEPGFRARIEKLQRELFQLPHFIEFCMDLARYVATDECRPNPSVAVALTGNTCESDASFGYPCNRSTNRAE